MRAARQLGIGPESLRHWVAQGEIDGGTRAGLPPEVRERMKTLERDNRELRRPMRSSKRPQSSSGRSSTAAHHGDPSPPLFRGWG